ncbi:hypothetical protein M2161_005895 [Streptomyces sp. SAI-133]|nr:hypothetical protein [Streptomyces sp. SAI-041]MDH6586789.1 hypothetical protein [Streptomyces sp. SAI-133]
MKRRESGRIGWRGRGRELASGLGALAAALTLTVWAASAASAGGPTSVLVVSPESGETASLYHSDEEYGELQRLLGSPGTGTRTKPPEANLLAARQINVTWMAHDVSPWRIDQVFPLADTDEVWIHTAEHVPESVNGHWHRANESHQLRSLLDDLGVMGAISGEGHAIFPAPEQAADGSAEAAPTGTAKTSASAAPRATEYDGTGWWWSLPGLAAGAVLALTLRPLALRRRWERPRREPGPRQELRDV